MPEEEEDDDDDGRDLGRIVQDFFRTMDRYGEAVSLPPKGTLWAVKRLLRINCRAEGGKMRREAAIKSISPDIGICSPELERGRELVADP